MTPTELLPWLQVATGFATLIALAVGIGQLAHTRRALALQTNLSVMKAEREIWALGMSNPGLAPNLMRERWGEPVGERLMAAMLIDHYETLYFQFRNGAILKANWAPMEKAMLEHIASPSIRTIWDGHKDLYWEPFRRFVDAHLNAHTG
jgi:hypothetical protein